MPEPIERETVQYKTGSGAVPFREWLDSLTDERAQLRISARLARLRGGNFGDHKALAGTDGVSELRLDFGPGYRIYYGEHEGVYVILLCGGDKGSQRRDIRKATEYWADYKRRIT